MRDDLPSVTAIYVAFMRAFATHERELSRACRDPYAEQLLPEALLPLLRRARGGRLGGVLSSGLRHLAFGLTDHLALRTALLDAALTQAVERGITQVVILGAGLDARAHRLSALASATVYEVDHPATQALKRHKASALPRAARELCYVPCDFAKTSFADALLDAGFDRRVPCAFLWEGVTMYLPESTVEQALTSISQLSAEGSLLLLTYLTPELVGAGELLGRMLVRTMALIAEPVRFAVDPDRLAALLAAKKFELLSDAVPREAAPHFGIEVTRPSSLLPRERIAVAKKTEDTP